MELIAILTIVIIGYILVTNPKKPPTNSSLNNNVALEVKITTEAQTPSRFNETEDTETIELYYFPVESTPRKINAQVKLAYVSTSGEKTERIVDVRAFYRGENGCLFGGFDHLRKAYRKLSSKCVKEAVDIETGEFISDIFAFFESKYIESPDYLYDYIFTKHGKEIYIFLYLACADGALREAERKIIANYCIEQEGFNTLSLEKLDELLKSLYRPSKYEFHQYTRTTEFNPTMWAVANNIVSTNTKPHSEQTRALGYIQKQWKHKVPTTN